MSFRSFADRLRGCLPCVTAVSVAATSLFSPSRAPGAFFAFDAFESPDPLLASSVPFQASRVDEFGDLIGLASMDPIIKVRVSMRVFAQQAFIPTYDDPGLNVQPGDTSWLQPIRLNIYEPPTDPLLTPNLILSRTGLFELPLLSDAYVADWIAVHGAGPGDPMPRDIFVAEFDFTGEHLLLPSQIALGILFNTEDAGISPTGFTGPYNSLNVALSKVGDPDPMPAVGTDLDNSTIFARTFTFGSGEFVEDSVGVLSNVAFQFVIPEPSRVLLSLLGTVMIAVRRRRD